MLHVSDHAETGGDVMSGVRRKRRRGREWAPGHHAPPPEADRQGPRPVHTTTMSAVTSALINAGAQGVIRHGRDVEADVWWVETVLNGRKVRGRSHTGVDEGLGYMQACAELLRGGGAEVAA